jgi:molybdenum cofactor guanylyltransferase
MTTTAGAAIAAAVIAGGPARRMGGVAKAGLVVDGESIAALQVRVLRRVFERVVVVANEPGPWAELPVELVHDRHAGVGPLAGLHAALVSTEGQQGVVCVAGDMPFVSEPLLRLLRDRAPEADAVVPRVAGRAEPLLARYARRCRAAVEAQLAAGERAVHMLLDHLAVSWLDEDDLRAVDPELRALTNVNTPDDLVRAQALVGRGRRR